MAKNKPESDEIKCDKCGLPCVDKKSLDRHIAWAHPPEKKLGLSEN